MNMRSENLFLKICHTAVVFLFFSIFFASSALAIPMVSELFDTSGEVVYSKDKIKKSPEKYIELMKMELQRGNLKMVGVLGRHLIELRPYNAEIKSIYSIYFASINEIEKAELEIKKSEDISGKNKYSLCAEAMIFQAKKMNKDAFLACQRAIAMDEAFSYSRNVLGTIYFDMKQYEKAADSFKKAIDLFPDFSLGHTNLGYAYLYSGNNENAVKYFKKAIALNPGSYNARNGLAIVYEKTGQPSLALEQLQMIQKNKPEFLAEGLERIGTLQLVTGMYEDAFKTGLEMEKEGMPGAYVILAKSCLLKNNTEKALHYIKKIDEKSASANYLKGIAMMAEGRFEEALKLVEDVLSEDQQNYEAYISKTALQFYLGKEIDMENELHNRWDKQSGTIIDFIAGNIYARKGDWEKAEKKWQAAQGMFKGFSILGVDHQVLSAGGLVPDELKHDTLGIIFYFIGLHENALAEFETAIRINENSIFGNYFAALIFLKNGDTAEAEKYLTCSTKKAPEFFSALSGIGELNFMKGENSKAATYYERALAVKKDPIILFKLGTIYERQKEYEKAAKLSEELIHQFPELYVGYNQLAWIYAVQEIHLDKALSYAKKANELKPGQPGILDTLGWVYYKKKQYGKSSEYLEKAVQAESTSPEINYHLGASYYAEGKKDLAKKYLGIALTQSETFDNASDARKILNQIK